MINKFVFLLCSLVSLQKLFLCDHDAKIQQAQNGMVL